MITIGVNGESLTADDLITSRSCIIAQSGAGKSYGIAVICEQLASNNLGFCIIDTEGEYSSLKQKFELLWVGGDEADIKIIGVDFEKLASRVINQGVPVIFDVSDVDDSKGLVNEWLNNLYKEATKIKRPYLLIIEEADKFVPQNGDKLAIIHEIARRGRKRGLGLMVASQRPALVDKNVLSQCNHQFIGRLTVEPDLKAVKHFFNSRKDLNSLTEINPGEFFMIGFRPEELLFKFRERLTTHDSSTPIIKDKVPARIMELIDYFSESTVGLGVKELLSKSDAEQIAISKCSRKYLFFGEKEKVSSVKIFYKPLIELELKVFNERLFKKEFVKTNAYLTPELKAVDNGFNTIFDLSFIKDLTIDEVRALIAIIYQRVNTINELMIINSISEDDARACFKSLESKGFIEQKGWKGKFKSYKIIKTVRIPRVISLNKGKLETSVSVNEKTDLDSNLINHVIKSLDSKTDILNSKVIYYPFYKIILIRGDISREFFINGVTGRLIND